MKLLSFAAAAACTVAPALADFTVPDGSNFPWSRGATPNSTWAQWEIFTSPVGPNAPDVGSFAGGDLPIESPDFDAFDSSGGSFVTGGGNLYSFSAPLNIHVVAPNFNLGDSAATTVLLQIRTQGTEFLAGSVHIGGVAPTETVELHREALGGFGGFLVDTLFRWVLAGNAISYEIRFDASGSSMSLDRVSVDTFTVVRACAADFNGDAQADFFDYLDFAAAFDAEDISADFNRDSQVDFFDYLDFVAAFDAGC